MIADLITRLFASGTPPELVTEVAMAMARLQAEKDAAETAERRSPAAIKQQRYRDNQKAAKDVTNGNDVTEKVTRDAVGNAAPALDKRNPQTPKKINPTPCVIPEPAREAEPKVPAIARLGAAQVAIAVVLHGAHLRRWKNVPPPAGVSAEQWRGFLDYRKARRKTLTDRAYQLLCGKLAKHADDDWPPGAIVDHMVFKNWLSFEPEWLTRTSDRRNGQQSHNNSQPRFGAATHPGGRHCAAADDVFGGMDG